MFQNLIEFVNQNPGKITGIITALYELFVRFRPTDRNWSLVDLAYKIFSTIVPNKATDVTTVKKSSDGVNKVIDNHVVKMIVLFLMISVSSFGQLNGTFKSIRSYHADSLTVKTEVQGLQLFYDSLVGALYYNSQHVPGKWRIFYDSQWHDLIQPVQHINFGVSTQVPFVNSTNNNFTYTNGLKTTTNGQNLVVSDISEPHTLASDIVGSLISGGSNVLSVGSSASWSIVGGEQNTITGGGGDDIVGGVNNSISKGSILIAGHDNAADAQASFVCGVGAQVSFANGNIAGIAVALNDIPVTPKVTAAGGSFNISRNTGAVAGIGANAFSGGILGGTDNTILAGANNSVIIGGNRMKMLATDTATLYAPNLRVRSFIGTGSRMVVTDATGHTSTQAIPGGASPGGVDRNIQFNNAGAFGGSAKMNFNTSDQIVLISPSGSTTTTVGNNDVGNDVVKITNVGGQSTQYGLNQTISSGGYVYFLDNTTNASNVSIGFNNSITSGEALIVFNRLDAGTLTFIINDLPTSSPCGTKPSGTLWNNSNVINICP